MKILLVNPSNDASQRILTTLKAAKVAVLRPENIEEAWQMLGMHGKSVDLAILHREDEKGAGDEGLKLAERIKADPVQNDLPYILTTSKWTEEECALHQGSSPAAANAYLTGKSVDLPKLVQLIEQVTGQKLDVSASPAPDSPALEFESPSFEAPTGAIEIDLGSSDTPAFKAEEATGIKAPSSEAFTGSIDLNEAPAAEEEDDGRTRVASIAALQEEEPIAFTMDSPPSSEGLSFDEPAVELGGGEAEDHTRVAQTLEFNAQTRTRVARPEASLGGEEPVDDRTRVGGLEASRLMEEADRDAESKLPYLFNSGQKREPAKIDASQFLGPAFGDAIVPGGAAQSPDIETLRKYLMLREQDVVALSAQLKSAHEHIRDVESKLEMERASAAELVHLLKESKQRVEDVEREIQAKDEGFEQEANELRFQLKARTDKVKVLEIKVRESMDSMEALKERVRVDIRKIRVREKELENRLEIQKRDAEALIVGRENKIVELKRKLDLLEFNMDLLQEQLAREKDSNSDLKKKLFRVSQAMKVAGGLIEDEAAKADAGGPKAAPSSASGEDDQDSVAEAS